MKKQPGDIHLESPKNLTWPNLNKPVTGKFGATMSTKPHFLGSGPFSEASYRPLTQFLGKAKKCARIVIWSLHKTWPGRIRTNLRPANLGQLYHQNPIFWVLGWFHSPHTGLRHNFLKKGKRYTGIFTCRLQKTLLGQIWTNLRLANLGQVCHQNHIFGVLGRFQRPPLGLRHNFWKSKKDVWG